MNEEVGITIDPMDATCVHLIHYIGDKEYLYVFFKVNKWRGEPTNKEPDKCDDLR